MLATFDVSPTSMVIAGDIPVPVFNPLDYFEQAALGIVYCVIAIIMMLMPFIILALLVKWAIQPSKWMAMRTEQAVIVKVNSAPNHTEKNKVKVVGWETASQTDLKSLKPKQLQAKLDRANPLADRIVQLSVMRDELTNPTTEKVRDKRQKLDEMIVRVRQVPLMTYQAQTAREATKLLEEVEEEIKFVLKEPDNES